MVDMVKQLGPYMVIAPGIALAHARPESGARRIGLTLITLATPVCFGNAVNDPVDIVVALAALDNNSHVQLLARLARFLDDETNLAALRQAKDPSQIVALVHTFALKKEAGKG